MPFSLSSSALNDYQRYLSLLVGNAAYVDTPPLTVDYLVVAGGGGSAGYNGGGAGAGGYRSSVSGESSGGGASAETPLSLAVSTNYTVAVGAGGSAGNNANGSRGTNGSNSVFSTITSVGGGTSGSGSGTLSVVNGSNGGSGGGAGGATGQNATPTSGESNQGFGGGDNFNSGGYGAGGGGGASAVGANGTTSTSGNGGAGISSSITGSSVARAGGGGGGHTIDGASRGTATDGGGNGGTSGAAGTAGTVNTGGGAGGGGHSANGATGGSGVVILKYPIAYDMTVGAGLGYKTVMSGDYKITEFTSGTGTVSFAVAPTVVGSGEDILQEIVLEESTSSVTFSGLDAYASTYQHLQVRMVSRSGAATTNTNIQIQFNSDTGTNYATHILEGNGSSVSSDNYTTRTSTWPAQTIGTSELDAWPAAIIDILDFSSTTKNKTIRGLSGWKASTNVGAGQRIFLRSGLWINTNAITQMLIANSGGSFIAGSRFTLIGVK